MLGPLARRAAADLTPLTRFVTAPGRHSAGRRALASSAAAMADDKFSLPDRYKGCEKNIWLAMA